MSHGLDRLYSHCTLCPRACGTDRAAGRTGFCGEDAAARVSVACLHRGEEPPLSGSRGSGTVFFPGCTLACSACQNHQLSGAAPADRPARAVPDGELAEIFLALEARGAHNINLVTGTQFIPSVSGALGMARERGLAVPIVWNSNGYETAEAIGRLAPHVDVWLPDLKTLDPETARALFGRADYPAVVKAALPAMAEAAGTRNWDNDLLTRGVIVRHLVVPGRADASVECLEWFRDNLNGRALLSLMFQYLPLDRGRPTDGARVTRKEYEKVMEALERFGIEDGFAQEPEESDDWLPDFTRPNPFPAGFATPVWHAASGFIPAGAGGKS